MGAVEGDLEHVGLCAGAGLGHGHRLSGREVGGGGKVEVGAVAEEFDGSGAGRGRSSVEEEGVEFGLASESGFVAVRNIHRHLDGAKEQPTGCT